MTNEAAALEYYRAGLEKRAPLYVPSRVRLLKRVTGDVPIGHSTMAEAGEHDCYSNKWGAISVRASNGKLLGIRPTEFEPLAWRENEKAEASK